MFESAKLKLERAYQHALNLDQVFGAYAYEHPYRALIYLDPQRGNDESRVWVEIQPTKPLPIELGLILGDAIHNYRCALDHMVWELFDHFGATKHRQLNFPVGDTRMNFEASVRGMKAAPQQIQQFFIDTAAYRDGTGRMLYAVNRLDNADKHTVVTPVLHASQVDAVTFIHLESGRRETRGPLFTKPIIGRAVLIEAEPGWGIDAKDNIEPTPGIFFGDVEVVPNEPIYAALAWIHQAVMDTINDAEKLVRSRP